MTDEPRAELTCLRYRQAINTLYRLYTDTYHTKFIYPQTFSTDSDKIMECLYKTYKKGTIINFISSILWSVQQNRSHDNNDLIDSICETYRIYGKKLKDEIDAENSGKEFELTEKEQKSFMIWEDILQIYEKMKKSLDSSDYSQMIEYVIVSLYVLHQPVRADYANMKIFIDTDAVPSNYPDNYCVLQPSPQFVFQKYKTSKQHGITVIPIENTLRTILCDWVSELNPSEWLLPTRLKSSNTFKPMSENALCKRIPDIFVKHGGKPVTINTLRHSYISWVAKDDQTYYEKETNATKMMHSTDMASMYRRMVYTK